MSSKAVRKSALSVLVLAAALGGSLLAAPSAEAYLNVQFVPTGVNGVPVDYSRSTAAVTYGTLTTGGVTVTYSATSTLATGAGTTGIPANARNPATGLGTNQITGVTVGTVISFNIVATITEKDSVPISTATNYANLGNFAGVIRSSGYTASNILGTFGAVSTAPAFTAGFQYGGGTLGTLQTNSTSVSGTAANFIGASSIATVNSSAGVQQSSMNYTFFPQNASSTTGSTLGWSFVMSSGTYTVTGTAGSENALQLFVGSSPNAASGNTRPAWFDGGTGAKSYRANSADLLGVGYWTGTTFAGTPFIPATATNHFMTPLLVFTTGAPPPPPPPPPPPAQTLLTLSKTDTGVFGPDVLVVGNAAATGYRPGERRPVPPTFSVGFRSSLTSTPPLDPGTVLIALDFEINSTSPTDVDDFTGLYNSLLASLPAGTNGFLFNTGGGSATKPDWIRFFEGSNQSYDMEFILQTSAFTDGSGGDYKFTLSNIPPYITLRGVVAVPEPSTLPLAAIPAVALLRRRKPQARRR